LKDRFGERVIRVGEPEPEPEHDISFDLGFSLEFGIEFELGGFDDDEGRCA
jgi:hypothetical protein